MSIKINRLEEHPARLRKNYLLGELHAVQNITNLAMLDVQRVRRENEIDVSRAHCKVHHFRRTAQQTRNDVKVEVPSDWTEDAKIVTKKIKELNGQHQNKADIPVLPEHLRDLFDRSCKNITDTKMKRNIAEMILRNRDAFAISKTDVGTCSKLKHKIETDGAVPVRQPLRMTPVVFEKEEFQYLEDQLKNGVIKPSKSAWASPVALVRKKDNYVPWYVDYMKLNDLTIKDAYPLLRIDMCIDCLASASIFCCVDLQSGY